MQLDLERSNRHLFHSIIPSHCCSCEENKREKARFVLRIECWTPEFEAEVLTITRRCLLLGLQCRDTDQKGNCSPVWPQQYGTGIWKRYKVSALTQFAKFGTPYRTSYAHYVSPERPTLSWLSCYTSWKQNTGQLS